MEKQPYLPKDDGGKTTWLNTYSTKLPTHAATLEISAADVSSVQNDNLMWKYTMDVINQNKKDMTEFTAYKNILRDGPKGTDTSTYPAFTAPGSVPTIVGADIFGRIGNMVKRIKGHKNYTEAIGKDLGIIGAEQTEDPNTMKPVLKLTLVSGGKPNVGWKKGNATAIRIEKAIGTGAFAFLAIDTVPDYLDTTALPATPVVWRYRAIYLIGDEIVGQMSDEAKITVG